MNKNNIAFYFLLLIFLIGCNAKEKKVLLKKYYPSGKLLSYGWYTTDSSNIAIDTIHKFYENGRPSEISIYDSAATGKLNGISMQGFRYEFNQFGKPETKQFYLDDNPIGDNFGYDKNGIINHYAFYWVDTTYVSYIEYDTLGKIKSELNTRSVLFNYIAKINNDTLKNTIKKSCDIKIIPSNPPRCRTKVNIDFISKNGFIIKSDSIVNIELFSKKYLMPDTLKVIKYRAIQYDSIINKYYNCIFETKL
jgi:antitoxin component YwqK of YwqJK toxin-antitoxin module